MRAHVAVLGALAEQPNDDIVDIEERLRRAEARAAAAEARANEIFARVAASIQLQDALDRATSSETRAQEAEARLATERATLESQLTLQTQGISLCICAYLSSCLIAAHC